MHEKHFAQSKLHHTHKKHLNKRGIEEIVLTLINDIYNTLTTAIITNDEKFRASPENENKAKIFLSRLLFNVVLELMASAII